MQEDLDVLKRALIGAERDLAIAATERLLANEVDPTTILEEGMAVAMFDLGEMWKRGEVFLPEVVASRRHLQGVQRASSSPCCWRRRTRTRRRTPSC